MMRKLVFLLLFSAGLTEAGAQAFDGDCDLKFYAGYMTVDGDPGLEAGADYGCNDWLSLGAGMRYRFAGRSETGEKPQGLEPLDVKFHADVHTQNLLGLPSWLDVYAGPFAGFNVGGLRGGVRVSFSEWLGAYIDCSRPLFNTFRNESNDEFGLYRGHAAVSVGITVNLE